MVKSYRELNKEYIKREKFITDNAVDLEYKFINYAKNNIDRTKQTLLFNSILQDYHKAKELEKGIFEFSLIHTYLNNFEKKFIISVYNDKCFDIMQNINGNEKVNNKTLKNVILNNEIKPMLIAFLSPQQLHPTKWIDLLNLKKYREDKENNIATSDLYKCRKCGERKSHISQLQIRCADEPVSTFVTCLVCHNTFVL